MRAIFAISLLVAAAAMAACSTIPRYEAASDIHAFLVAIRDGDRAAFDDHVDRPALKAQLRSRVMADAAKAGGPASAGAAYLAGPLVDLGVDALVRPEVFRAIALQLGYAADRPVPGVLAIGQYVRALDEGRACVAMRRDRPCVLIFKQEGARWRLIGFEGSLEFGRGGKLKLSS